MLELKSLLLRNYSSYGDYDTIIELDELGLCLITGEVHDGSENSDEQKFSNGSGKSSIVEAILWCLFGRTMRVAQPGDKVINYFTGKGCIVELAFKNGDRVRRTRDVDGHNDLLYIRNGEDGKGDDVSLGTNNMQQRQLEQQLGIDWDIFCGSTFFSQFGQSWMEISDQRRKEALEREFHMDRIQNYADVAKEKLGKSEEEQARLNTEVATATTSIESLNGQIEEFKSASAKFEEQKSLRVTQIEQIITQLRSQRTSIKFPDLDAVKKKWEIYNKAGEGLKPLQQALNTVQNEVNKIDLAIENEDGRIEEWTRKGPSCSECGRPYDKKFIAGKVEAPQTKLKELQAQKADAAQKAKTAGLNLAAEQSKVQALIPPNTVAQIEMQIRDKQREQQRIDGQIASQEKALASAKAEENHFNESITSLGVRISKLIEQTAAAKLKVTRLDRLIAHLNYIYRAYSDRRKIKSYMLEEYIPYLNTRIAYYLGRFGFDLKIEFTNALGIKSDKWGYQQFSGGECKRFDVAMMLAMFYLHTLMYGRHCNVVVFDEVDGRLDMGGAEVFADIIKSDFAGKVDSVLVISQRLDMRGVLPTEMKIVREDRFSRVSEILK